MGGTDARTRDVICLSTVTGGKHDFILLKDSRIHFSKKPEVLANKGYQGIAKLHENRSSAKDEEPALELNVDMYNINYGKSKILQRSRSLSEYSTFIHYVRRNQAENGKPLEEAITAAISRAVKEGIMK